MKYIFFNNYMISLILNGVKTQTRRPKKTKKLCYGEPGDLIAVIKWTPLRNWLRHNVPGLFDRYLYRIFVECVIQITAVRTQKLLDISYEDAIAEGARHMTVKNKYVSERVHDMFHSYWDSIYGNSCFDTWSNPVVWAINFRRVHGLSLPSLFVHTQKEVRP